MEKFKKTFFYLFLMFATCFSSSSFSITKAEENVSNSIFIDPKTLIKQVSSIDISDDENSYLINSGYGLTIEKLTNPNDCDTAALNGKNFVYADEHVVSDNKHVFKYIPYQLHIEDENLPFTKTLDRYCVDLNDFPVSSNFTISYKTSISIDNDYYNSMLNSYYNYLSNIHSKKIQYLENLELYNQYLNNLEIFEQENVEYNKYLLALNEYEAENEIYQRYLHEKAAYEQNKLNYEKYLQDKAQFEIDFENYNNFLKELESYELNYSDLIEQFNSYQEQMVSVNHVFEIMELIYTPMTNLKRTLYSAIMGNAVSRVLEEKQTLLDLGIDANAINDAGEATVYLRNNVLNAYKDLKTDQEKYSFYFSKRNQTRLNFEKLLRCLDYLFKDKKVSKIIKSEDGYEEKYDILLAQLSYFCNAIDDEPVYNYEYYKYGKNHSKAAVFDENYLFNGKTYKEILKLDSYLDTSLEARTYTYILPEPVVLDDLPSYEGNIPVMPKEVKLLNEPVEVDEPVAPDFLEKPVAPSKVSLPINVLSDEEMILADSFSLYSFRENLSEELFFDFYVQSDEISFENKLKYLIQLNDFEGKLFKNIFIPINNSTNINIKFDQPSKPSYHDETSGDTIFYYIKEWRDIDDNLIDFNNLSLDSSIICNPIFDVAQFSVRICYDLTSEPFFVQNFVLNDFVNAIDIPSTPSKQETETEYYQFIGYSENGVNLGFISSVTANQNHVLIANFKPIKKSLYKFKHDNGEIIKYGKNFSDIDLPLEKEISYQDSGIIHTFKEWALTKADSVNKIYEYQAIYDVNWYVNVKYFVDNQEISSLSTIRLDNENDVIPSYLPTKDRDSEYFYLFDHWEKEENHVGKTVNYVAKFKKIPICTDSSNHIVSLKESDADITLTYPSTDNSFDISSLIKIYEDENIKTKQLNIFNENFNISFSPSQVRLLYSLDAKTIKLNVSDDKKTFKLELFDKNNNPILSEFLTTQIDIYGSFDSDHGTIYSEDQWISSALIYSNKISLFVSPGTEYTYKKEFKVIVSNDLHSNVILTNDTNFCGEIILISINFDVGYMLNNILLVTKGGDEISMFGENQFVIPEDDVIIYCSSKRQSYSVDFKVDGETIYSTSLLYGETPKPPMTATKASDSEYVYYFAGWDKPITKVTEDCVYNAVFLKEKITEKGLDERPSIIGNGLFIGVGIILLLTLFVLFISLKKSKKKRKH